LKRSLRTVLVAGALSCLWSGCGPGDPKAPVSPAIPSPNRRIMADERYKDLIGKDGKPVWTPGQPMRPPQ
jgi:hypothetical protein